MLEDSTFANNLRCRWEMLRGNILSNQWFESYIDSVAFLLDESQQRNFTVWPILGVYVWPNPWPYPPTYAAEIESLKNWIFQRLQWMDINLPGTCYTLSNNTMPANGSAIRLFPNPVENALQLGNLPGSNNISQLEIVDAFGRIVHRQEVRAEETTHIIDVGFLKAGIYTMRLTDGKTIHVNRFVKK
jgi:hypothetical protein